VITILTVGHRKKVKRSLKGQNRLKGSMWVGISEKGAGISVSGLGKGLRGVYFSCDKREWSDMGKKNSKST